MKLFRRLLIVLLLMLGPLASQTTLDDIRLNVLSFERPYERFLRDLFGCSLEEGSYMTKENCHPAQGTINYTAYKKARDAAKKLFDLAEPE